LFKGFERRTESLCNAFLSGAKKLQRNCCAYRLFGQNGEEPHSKWEKKFKDLPKTKSELIIKHEQRREDITSFGQQRLP